MTSVIAQGGKDDLERFSKTLQLPERGKVYVKGLFDDFSEDSGSIGGGVEIPVEAPATAAIDAPNGKRDLRSG